MNRILLAADFAAKAHKDQKRKYTNEPYINHPIAVAYKVGSIFDLHGLSINTTITRIKDQENMICAALLHDTVEDCGTNLATIERLFDTPVANLVEELTDQFSHEFDNRNRKLRKADECGRLAMISLEAQIIKCADLIDNTKSIVEHDANFAKTYLEEKGEILHAIKNDKNPLWAEAYKVYSDSLFRLSLLKNHI